jgi:predicted metal-dependent peptidase
MRLGLMAHEVLHAALLHMPRCGTREPLLWNIAADIVVNGIILAQAGFELPAGHLRDKELEQLSVEEIYHLLQGRRKQYISFTTADLLWSHGPGRDGYAGLEEYWRQALQRAKTLAETMGHGTQPAGLERELTQMSAAQLDWRAYLWRFMVRTPNDFQGYDRRFIGQRLYLETLEGESVRVYVAFDTSGSIGS